MTRELSKFEAIALESYSNIARNLSKGIEDACCETSTPSSAIPSLGCETQLLDLADLGSGEVVVDLGSGPGKDSLEAAGRVGLEGYVIGIDYSEEMITLARQNAEKDGIKNVEYRLGSITDIPVDDQSVDVVISNCVINLVEDKQEVFNEAFRILKSGGRLVVSDIITHLDPSQMDLLSPEMYCACVGGATSITQYVSGLEEAGFEQVEALERSQSNYKTEVLTVPFSSVTFIAHKP